MRTSLDHLPPEKQADVARIVEVILASAAQAHAEDTRPEAERGRVEMIILFGSHARGDWVTDHYAADGIMYEYISDYDVLVITDESGLPRNYEVWERAERRFGSGRPRQGIGSAAPSIIVHTAREVNRALEDNNSFFIDVKQEGIVLYDAGRVRLADARPLTPEERKARAQEESDRWMGTAKRFFETFEFCMQKSAEDGEYLKTAAFNLHQATESLYTTSCMVFTDYRPKSHDLHRLRKRVGEYDRRLLKGFAHHTPEQKQLFQLLADAYVHARYTKTYTITKEQLDYLADRVRKLQHLTEEACREHIARLG